MKKRIAIIGTGISGLTCGYLLNKNHDITVFEANDYIGGHTHTVDVEVNGESHAIDTGFIVFNDWTYPNFIKLMEKLGVASQPTEMSFSVTNKSLDLEYNGNNLNSLFAQRRNLIRPQFWRLVRDILRFNDLCKTKLKDISAADKTTLWEFIEKHKFSPIFAENYILPMCAAIWSTSLEGIKSFPLKFFLQFFNNHGLLNITNRPQWYTLIGGSRSYIKPLTKEFAEKIVLSCPVESVRKLDDGYELRFQNRKPEHFDEVILSCHSDQALKMLENPSSSQTEILGAIPYASNEVVLHTDTSILPTRKLAWASWNYSLTGEESEKSKPATVTYDMNILQRLKANTTFCVTLNNTEAIDKTKILRSFNYSHPQFGPASMAAQKRRLEICGVDGMHFCGAYWYNGFHEDGVRSALDVCKRFGEEL